MSGSDLALRQAVQRLRRRWRGRVLLEGAARVAIAVVLALVAGAALNVILGGGSGTTVAVRVIGYLLIAAALARYVVVPDAGHSALEPGIRAALVNATESFRLSRSDDLFAPRFPWET